MSLDEFQLISRFFKRTFASKDTAAGIKLGIGDDAAILQVPDGHQLAVSSDTLVEAVHFPENAPADLIARRALRVNLSDMAAMAATPKWFTLALTIPNIDERWLSAFSEGLHKEAMNFGCPLVGGDTAKGPLNIGIQILGTIENAERALKRSGAKAGDLLVVTGSLGDAAGALEIGVDFLNEQHNKTDQDAQYLRRRYWLPEPRIAFAQAAKEYANAACDISDGLIADVGHICEASDLGAEIDAAKIPVSSHLKKLCTNEALKFALTGGDDYELCMAISPDQLVNIERIAKRLSLAVTVVGRFCLEKDVSCVHSQDDTFSPEKFEQGYKHF